MNKKILYIVISILGLFVVALTAVIAILAIKVINEDKDDSNQISNFQECEEAGYPILESYPRQCEAPNGTFTEDIGDGTGLANPASVYCEENDGTLVIEDAEDGQIGMCQFEDGSECEEWKYYNNECAPGDSLGEAEELTFNVYFFDTIKFNEPSNTDYVTKVTRSTSRKDMAAFVMEEIIKGPNLSEQATGLEPTFGENKSIWFISDSTCSGKDFTITIDNGKATVQFCRDTMLAGDMSGFIIEQQVEKSLKQFSTIQHVRILNSNGDCFNDMKGVTPEECWD